MGLLAGKSIIVTGASSGIGRAAALLFVREGANLVLAARREGELDALRDDIEAEPQDSGERAVVLAGDVRDENHARALVACARDSYGGLDGAFNNAGALGEMAPAQDLSLAAWNETLATNLTGAFLCAKHQIPALLARGKGAIVFTSSFVGQTAAFPGTAAYAAAKAGLVGMTQAMAVELGPRGVRVNALLAGGADTPGAGAFIATPEARVALENLYALKRIAAPDEIAQAALFLLSDAASFVTGSAMLVDGGVSINRT